jgi:hypothetical protein
MKCICYVKNISIQSTMLSTERQCCEPGTALILLGIRDVDQILIQVGTYEPQKIKSEEMYCC